MRPVVTRKLLFIFFSEYEKKKIISYLTSKPVIVLINLSFSPGTDSILPDLQTDQAQDELDVSSIIKDEVEDMKQVLGYFIIYYM